MPSNLQWCRCGRFRGPNLAESVAVRRRFRAGVRAFCQTLIRTLFASPAAATSALAIFGPTPGIVCKRRHAWSSRANASSCASKRFTRSSSHTSSSRSLASNSRIAMGNPLSASSTNSGTPRRNVPIPCPSTSPYSNSKPPHLVGQRRTLAHRHRPSTMQVLKTLLLNRLDRHEAHRWTTHRLADRLRVAPIVLVRLHIRLDELRAHQPRVIAHRPQLASPMMGASARLHPHHARLVGANKLLQTPTRESLLQHDPARPVHCAHVKRVLDQVNPHSGNLAHGPPRSWCCGKLHLGPAEAVGEAGRTIPSPGIRSSQPELGT